MSTQNAEEPSIRVPRNIPSSPTSLHEPAPWRVGEVVVLVAILVAAITIRLLFFVGTRGGDDLRHAFHGYFLFAPDDIKHAVIGVPDGTIFRRMGINLPVWLLTRVFGPHEWVFSLVPLIGSLIGVVAIHLLLRRLAGRAAGLTAAAMWAFLPADVRNATLLLQDNVLASLMALFLFLMVSAHLNVSRSFVYALLAGLVLGYLQYVKRSAMVLIPPLIVWEIIMWWRTRKLRWLSLHTCLGFILMHAAFGLLFWHLKGDFWWYWRETLLVTTTRLSEDNHAPAEILASFRLFFFNYWALGGTVVLLPIVLPAAFLDRRVPARMFFAALLATQTFVLWQAWRMVGNQQRYTLLVSPLIIAIVLLGVFSLLTRLPRGLRRLLTVPVCLLLLAVTAWPLELRAQRGLLKPFEAHWLAYRYLDTTAEPDDKIYGKTRARAKYKKWKWDPTLRALYQFNEFEKFKGGFADVAGARDAKSGWVILSGLDMRNLDLDTVSCPEHWLEVYHAGRGGRRVRVFKILPEPLAVKPRLFVTRPTPPVAAPDVSDLNFRPIRLTGPLDQYRSHWGGKSESVTVEFNEPGLRCAIKAAADPKSRDYYVGLRLPVPQMNALRLDLSFVHPENITYAYVDVYDARRRRLARWRWKFRSSIHSAVERASYVFVPGEPIGYFQVLENNVDRPIAEAHLFLRVGHGQEAGVVIHGAEVASFAPREQTESVP